MKNLLMASMLLAAVAFADGGLPDQTLTPGATIPGVTKEQVCQKGWAGRHRAVTSATKKAVFRRYQVAYQPGKYEIDHLISLELGGSNDITNLWPEPYDPRPGAHEKDSVEDDLHQRVCSGALELSEAQTLIKTDWLSYYEQLKGRDSDDQPK